MNASEISYIETRLPVAVATLPSPEHMLGYEAKVRQVRNEHMASLFLQFFRKASNAVAEIRRIAVACTAARLHQQAL